MWLTTLVASGALLLFVTAPAAAVWTSNGPTDGNVLAVAFDPTSPATAYAGTSSGGFFKSVDGGVTWSASSTGVTNVSGTRITGLAVDPVTPTRVYATSDTGVNQGVFRSTNAGASWSFAALDATFAVAIHPTTPTTLYVSGAMGVYKSTDAGDTWTAVLSGQPFFCLAIDPSAPDIVYAGANTAVYKSSNGGATWTAFGAGLQSGEAVLALAVHPTISLIVYAGQEDGGVRKSVDGGNNWTGLGPIVGSPPGDLVAQSLAIDPASPDTVYVGGFTVNGGFSVYKSTDGGANWSSTPLTALVTALALDASTPATLLAGTVDGIARTTNAATSWSFENAGLVNTAVIDVALDATPGTVYSAREFSGVSRSTDGGASWEPTLPIPFDRLRSLAADPTVSGTLYGGSLLDGVFKSTDAGANWTAAAGGTPPVNVEALLVDPTATNVVYAAGYGGVYRSTIGGGNWTEINSGITVPVVVSLAIDPSAPDSLYAGVDPLMGAFQGVFKTTNAGGMWTPVNTGLPNVAEAAVVALLVDPATPQTVYAAIESAGVYKTTDGGANWAAASTGLPSTALTSLAHDPTTGILFAGLLDTGVFFSADGGASWAALNSGLFNLTTNALAVDAERIYAGSGGDGTFVMPLASIPLGQPLSGKKLIIKDPKPEDPAKRKIIVLASEIGSDDTLDPAAVAANGAILTITAEGATPSSQMFALPAPWTLTGSTGAKYLDKTGANGPVKLALLKKAGSGKFKLKVLINGKLGPGPQPHVTVVPPNPGTGASVLLHVTGGDAYCVAFGGAAGGELENTPEAFTVKDPTAQACAP